MEKNEKNNVINGVIFLQPDIKGKLAKAFKSSCEGSISEFLSNLRKNNLKLMSGNEDDIIKNELLEAKLYKVYKEYIREEIESEYENLYKNEKIAK